MNCARQAITRISQRLEVWLRAGGRAVAPVPLPVAVVEVADIAGLPVSAW